MPGLFVLLEVRGSRKGNDDLGSDAGFCAKRVSFSVYCKRGRQQSATARRNRFIHVWQKMFFTTIKIQHNTRPQRQRTHLNHSFPAGRLAEGVFQGSSSCSHCALHIIIFEIVNFLRFRQVGRRCRDDLGLRSFVSLIGAAYVEFCLPPGTLGLCLQRALPAHTFTFPLVRWKRMSSRHVRSSDCTARHIHHATSPEVQQTSAAPTRP